MKEMHLDVYRSSKNTCLFTFWQRLCQAMECRFKGIMISITRFGRFPFFLIWFQGANVSRCSHGNFDMYCVELISSARKVATENLSGCSHGNFDMHGIELSNTARKVAEENASRFSHGKFDMYSIKLMSAARKVATFLL